MSSPSIICILTVSFSESSPLSPLRHFLPPFSSIWPLTSQGPPAYAASAGLLSNQILTVKVCPSQPIIPASPDTCGHPCSQTSVPSYLTLFHFFFPLLLCSHKPLCWEKTAQAECLFLQLWLLASMLCFLCTLSIFLIIRPLLSDGLPSLWAWLSLGYGWPSHFSQAPSKGRARLVHALLLFSFSPFLLCPCPKLANMAVYNVVLHSCFEFQTEGNCCVYWQ